MMYYKNIIFLMLGLLILCASDSAFAQNDALPAAPAAQENSAERKINSSNLRELLQLAFANNPLTKAARAEYLAESAMVPQARSLPDPNLTLKKPLDGSKDYVLELMQMIPNPRYLSLRGKRALTMAEMSRIKYEKTVTDVLVDPMKSYYELGYLSRASIVSKANRDLFAQLVDLGRLQNAQGAIAAPELFAAETRLAQSEYEMTLLEQLREVEKTSLRKLLGVAPDFEIGDIVLPEPQAVPLDRDAIRKAAIENNQELAMAGLSLDIGNTDLSIARSMRIPDLSIGLMYGKMETTMGVDEMGDPMTSTEDEYTLMLGMNLPIWAGKNNAMIKEARERRIAADELRKNQANTIYETTDRLYFKTLNLERLFNLYKNSLLPQARNASQLTQTLYEQDKTEFSELLETRMVVGNFEIASARAQADYLQSLAELFRLTAGETNIFDALMKTIPEPTATADGENLHDDYSDLIAKYKSSSAIDTIKSISDLFSIIDPDKTKDLAKLEQKDILDRISKDITDSEILNIIVAKSNRIARAREEYLASVNEYPQTMYLQDILKTFHSFSEGMSLGIGTEYQQDMIQMYYPSPGMLSLRGKIVDADVEMAWMDFLKESRDVISDARILLAEIRRGEDMISINTESASMLKILSDVARAQYKSGTRSFSELARLETELDQRQDTVNRMKSMQSGLIAELLSMMSLPVNSPMGKINWTFDDTPKIEIDKLRSELPSTRQELRNLALQVEKMDTMLEMSRKNAAPDKTLGFSFYQGQEIKSLNTNPTSEMKNDDMQSMSSDSQMEMPKDDFMEKPMVDHRQSNFVSDSLWALELVNRRNAMIEMLKTDTNMDTAMLEMLYNDYTQMVKSEKLHSGTIIPKAKAALDVVKKGYSSNENDFNDLISAELAYLMARMDLADTRFELRKSLIEIERLVGKMVTTNK